jgi:hypothetical protein
MLRENSQNLFQNLSKEFSKLTFNGPAVAPRTKPHAAGRALIRSRRPMKVVVQLEEESNRMDRIDRIKAWRKDEGR